jgi:hypothetical protein
MLSYDQAILRVTCSYPGTRPYDTIIIPPYDPSSFHSDLSLLDLRYSTLHLRKRLVATRYHQYHHGLNQSSAQRFQGTLSERRLESYWYGFLLGRSCPIQEFCCPGFAITAANMLLRGTMCARPRGHL